MKHISQEPLSLQKTLFKVNMQMYQIKNLQIHISLLKDNCLF
jgi:hypothetical protein